MVFGVFAQTPALNYAKQFARYDAVYKGDWRFVPSNMTATDSYILDSITNKSFSAFVEITTGSASCFLNFKIPANSQKILTTFTIDDSDGFIKSFTESTNSTNGTDGTWTDIAFTFQNWEYHDATTQLLNFEPSITDRWIKLLWTNSASGTLQIKDVGVFKLNTRPEARNDYWLALGASIMNSAINTTEANLYAREMYGQDPLIVNLGYPGKTIAYLADSLYKMLDANPDAGYSFVHMGGNDVSNTRPWSTVAPAVKEDFINNTKSVMVQLDEADIINFYGRISYRRYIDAPSVEDGVYEELGSLPYNEHTMDSLIPIYNKRAYHSDGQGKPVLDYYGHNWIDSAYLNVDGIHLATEGKVSWREYSVEIVGDYIYNYVKTDTLYYTTWLEYCDITVSLAESSTLNADIVNSQYYVTKLPDGTDKTNFQVRIDAIICSDCSVTNVYVNIGFFGTGGDPGNWNEFQSRVVGNNETALIDDGGGVTAIAIKSTSGWDTDGAGYNSSGIETGDNSGIFPDAVMGKGFYVRGIDKDFTFYNLDNTKTYTIEIVGNDNLDASNKISTFTIGGTSIDVNASLNSTLSATFTNLSPDGNDEIIINTKSSVTNGYGYINGIKIKWSN